ncbi:MAG: serine hydrolase domain-containing protein [Pseudomonadota bacterium]
MKTPRLIAALCLGAALASPAAAEDRPIVLAPAINSPGAEAFEIRELEKALDAAYASGDFVGLAVAVVKGGETRFLKTYGVAELGGAVITPRTVFRIGSLSKGFAASLAGIAMNEGLLSPTDPATRYAPGLKLAGGAEQSLELGHLLSHQTGLPPNAYDNLLEANVPVAEIYPKYKGVKPICPVGKCYSYQNIAFDIAGSAISSVYGEPYADAAEKRLFGPLGMASASIGEAGLVETGDWARPHVRARIKGKDKAFGPWREASVKPAYYRVPAAGGVNASILDMTLWLKAQMGRAPDVLSPDVLDLIHTPRIISPAETARVRSVSPRFHAAQYAFGWRLYNYGGAQVIAHAGTVEGYAAQIAWLPDEDAGIVILSNARSRRMWRILPTFLDLELGLSREDWLELTPGEAAAP